jgi:hypothetical protein
MKGQRIRQRSPSDTRGRVHDHACRFVDYHEKVIFINDLKRNVFGSKAGEGQRGQFRIDLIVRAQFIGWLRGATVDNHIAVVNQALQSRTTPGLNVFGEKGIKPLTG